ncbi:inosine-uridine preferring nucleoside hydrolase family protein [Actinidia rufa]|uniref:Inosine-uridine preferring nucleoside hydrolase family protein n=1 Tax=Actinidia rufa TaxID=165716 RepID=A0A7J0EFF6_9ERIC|nr:inosine-uridine preferring nucleoside hydrolase family protein [Actinidia rufa]
MLLWRRLCVAIVVIGTVVANLYTAESGGGRPHRILLDTDVDTDDFFALLYLLKLNRAEFDLQTLIPSVKCSFLVGFGWDDVVKISASPSLSQMMILNSASVVLSVLFLPSCPDKGRDCVYDILYMMGRDDIAVAVGVGGEGGILEDGTIQPDVGGYLPIIDQGIGTAGYCRYRQAIPVGQGGRLDIDSNYGFRKSFLPQGSRKYSPLRQPTAQQVMIDKVSAGPITNPTGCCPKNASSSCQPRQCGDRGNLFTVYTSNPYAEFNIFGDPFAAYQVIHSGIPVTLVPLDATNTIPINEKFFEAFEQSQHTYEAQYCFKSLKMARDTWFDDQFYTSYFMWDSFTSGVATSIMITSNRPYGVSDGSNPFFDGLKTSKFNLKKGGVHSGHVQARLRDPFCIVKNGKGRCKDGYTMEKLLGCPEPPSTYRKVQFHNTISLLQRSSLQTGFWDFGGTKLGKNVVFDMDMSAGDFLALFYLLKLPVEVINLKAILVSPTGWANAATIDVIYDLLHMMGRDDIPVGLGDVFGMNQSDSVFSGVGDCKYLKAIPHGSGGLLDSDTLYGLARDLPRSPRRYTAENSVKFGAPRDTDHPELRQPLALEIWESVLKSLDSESKITILTNGPLTNLAKIILSDKNITSLIQDVYIVGGHINYDDNTEKGNVFSVPSNEYAEFNMFLDPLAAKTVFDSGLDITLVPLGIQRKVSTFPKILEKLHLTKKTPEAMFTRHLLSRLHSLQRKHHRYQHMDTFLGEILGAVILGGDHSITNSAFKVRRISVTATGVEYEDGNMKIDEKNGKSVRILENLDPMTYYALFANRLGDEQQSAVVGSFEEQRRTWSSPPK